jgi:parvulin-like peptidyl-prolyl isomerase
MSFLRCSVIAVLVTLGCGLAAAQQQPAAETPPAQDSAGKDQDSAGKDKIVAVIEGKGYTAEEIEWIRKNIPPEFATQTAHMTYGGFLEALALQIAVAKRAEELHLIDKEPYRTRLEINKRIFLTNAYLSEIQQDLKLTQADYREFYEKHQQDYEDVRLSAISLDYSLNPEKAPLKEGKQARSEKEAWVRAEELLVEMRQGKDFADVARENSDDKSAAAKGGDMGYFRRDSQVLPEPLKGPIFELNEGEVSAPVKLGGRYYIFKVVERRTLSYTEALPDILRRIQGVKITEKLDEIRSQMQLEIKDPAFGASKPAEGPAPAAPPKPPAPPAPPQNP